MAKTQVTAPGIATDAVTVNKLPNTSITNAKLVNDSITINGTEVVLGGTIADVGTETYPTVSSVSPTVITNAQTTVTITGTNFVSIPIVEAINTSGAITTADSVTYVSATSVQAALTLPVDGTYFLRVTNVTTGLSGRSGSAILNLSDEPACVTAAGSLGTFSGSVAISTITLTCTDATSFAVTSGAVTAGLTFTRRWLCYNNRNTNGSYISRYRFIYGDSNRC